jgi:hypothetical protein
MVFSRFEKEGNWKLWKESEARVPVVTWAKIVYSTGEFCELYHNRTNSRSYKTSSLTIIPQKGT